ncbi:MAG: helix-turn-helix domain-containing protein [Flavobacteriaceae bacterium]|jgi:transcriptional regulator with XRE-family HTH domain|nr:helix-turn-helix domain-containing protein [Flavobacteriaceae bacterium]
MTKTIADKIKRLRKDNGFSQEEIAEKLNISQSAYARLENGESYSWATHLEKLSEIYGVKPESFLNDDANHFSNQEQAGGMAFQFVGTINTINALSEKLIEQYEDRLQEMKDRIKELKEEIRGLKKQ